MKRPRHLPTVGIDTASRSATCVFVAPPAAASTILQRSAYAWVEVAARAPRLSWARSSSLSTNAAFGLPISGMPSTVHL